MGTLFSGVETYSISFCLKLHKKIPLAARILPCKVPVKFFILASVSKPLAPPFQHPSVQVNIPKEKYQNNLYSTCRLFCVWFLNFEVEKTKIVYRTMTNLAILQCENRLWVYLWDFIVLHVCKHLCLFCTGKGCGLGAGSIPWTRSSSWSVFQCAEACPSSTQVGSHVYR